ncbi:RNA ligase/cyclic nucleotide phosphodiesterase [Trichoderma sp. SZMC 28014]
MATKTAKERPLYPRGIPSKFSSDGVLQRLPGNTLICHLPPTSPLQPGLNAVYASLSSHPVLSKLIHLLPKVSWHMTVLGGIHGDQITPGKRPPAFKGRPLEEVTKAFSQKLKQLGLELENEGLAPPYKMKIRGFDGAKVGIGLEVGGATAEEEKRIRLLRDRLADVLGLRRPNHETYGFHITMAYLMRYIEGKNRKMLNALFEKHLSEVQLEFELGAVEFCTYENMYAFARLFYLGESF